MSLMTLNVVTGRPAPAGEPACPPGCARGAALTGIWEAATAPTAPVATVSRDLRSTETSSRVRR